jgi:DNA-binding MarR family transcriptional regulator
VRSANPAIVHTAAAEAAAHGSPGGPAAEAEPQLADGVARLRRAMRRAARARGRDGSLPGGLSVAQLELLSALADTPGLRPGQLARSLRLAPSSVATLVNGLLRGHMITRTGGSRDRRTALIELTTAGQQAVTAWQQVNAQILRAALTGMTDASRAALLASLPALRELADAVDALADTADPPAS